MEHKKKVLVSKEDTKETLMKKGLSRTTAWRALKRGWYYKDFRKKVQNINLSNFNPEKTLDIVNHVQRSKFWGVSKELAEDLQQEAVLRCIELSGISTDRPFQWRVSQIAMWDFLKKQVRKHHSDKIPLEESITKEIPEFDNPEVILNEIKTLIGETLYEAALSGNKVAIEKIKELI